MIFNGPGFNSYTFQVFIPICTENVSEMVKLSDMRDYESLPCTKFGLKQPATVENRENAMETGGIDLFIVPGLLFSIKGSRLGHGLGFYDKYFQRHHEKYPQKKTVLMAIAFLEQVVKEGLLPVEEHDVLMDFVVTENCVYSSK